MRIELMVAALALSLPAAAQQRGSINDIEAQLKSATNAMSLLTGLYDRVSRVLAGRF
jgi:hypothetical protein